MKFTNFGRLVLVLVLVTAVSACERTKSGGGNPLAPGELITTPEGELLSSLFTINKIGNGVAIKYHGEPKLSMPPGVQIPVMLDGADSLGNPVQSQNTIVDLVFDDHTCQPFKRIRMQFASASPSEKWKTSGTYVEFVPCGNRLDLRWGVRMTDGRTYHSGNRFTVIESSNINARLVGDRIVSDPW